MIYKRWSNEDDNFLKENYGKIPAREIAKTLNVTRNAVIKRANCNFNLKSDVQVSSYGMKGKYHSKESKEIMKLVHIGKLGEKSSNWKGDNVGYHGVHYWIRKNKPKPEYCEDCKKQKRLTIANISGKYLRDIKDYKWLCYKCHSKFDFPNGVRGINLK
jgi:hypothetical protein